MSILHHEKLQVRLFLGVIKHEYSACYYSTLFLKSLFMKKKLCFLILISFLALPQVFAQDDDLPPVPDEPDVPPAPINDYLPILILVGAAYSSWKLIPKKNTTITKP
jgi:hypothetical protein